MDRDSQIKSDLLNLIASASVNFDVKGSPFDVAKIPMILMYYFAIRTYIKWTTEELKKLRPFLMNFRANFPSSLYNINVGRNAVRYLMCKSALVFIAEDFPFIAESILYSDLMENVDQTLDSWNVTDTLFEDYKCFKVARMLANCPDVHAHKWWSIVLDVKKINGIPIEQLKVQYEEEQKKKEQERAAGAHQ